MSETNDPEADEGVHDQGEERVALSEMFTLVIKEGQSIKKNGEIE